MAEETPEQWEITTRDRIMDLGFRVEQDKKGFLAHELLGERIVPEHRRHVKTLEELLALVEAEVTDHPSSMELPGGGTITPIIELSPEKPDFNDADKAVMENLVRKALPIPTTKKENRTAMVDPKLRSETAGEKPFLHSVKTPLTDKEMLIYTDELTAVDTKEKEILHTFESQKTAYKSEQADIDSQKNHLMHLLKTKEEWKDIDCVNQFNFHDGTCEIVRKDTGEVVQTRKMNADEFRRALPFAVEKKEDAAAAS